MTQEEEREGFIEPEDKDTLNAMKLQDTYDNCLHTIGLIKDSDRKSLYEGKEDER